MSEETIVGEGWDYTPEDSGKSEYLKLKDGQGAKFLVTGTPTHYLKQWDGRDGLQKRVKTPVFCVDNGQRLILDLTFGQWEPLRRAVGNRPEGERPNAVYEVYRSGAEKNTTYAISYVRQATEAETRAMDDVPF